MLEVVVVKGRLRNIDQPSLPSETSDVSEDAAISPGEVHSSSPNTQSAPQKRISRPTTSSSVKPEAISQPKLSNFSKPISTTLNATSILQVSEPEATIDPSFILPQPSSINSQNQIDFTLNQDFEGQQDSEHTFPQNQLTKQSESNYISAHIPTPTSIPASKVSTLPIQNNHHICHQILILLMACSRSKTRA